MAGVVRGMDTAMKAMDLEKVGFMPSSPLLHLCLFGMTSF